LPSGSTYNCVSTSSLHNTNGTGWIPVDLTLVSAKSPLSSLPSDPTNSSSTGLYYTYTPGNGVYELTSILESAKYAPSMRDNGGIDPAIFEKGTSLSLASGQRGLVGYWNFDEGTGTTAADSSGNSNMGTLTNGPTWTTSCKVSGCLSFDGTNDYVDSGNNSILRITGTLTVIAWVKPTAPGKRIIAKNNAWDIAIDGAQKIRWAINGAQLVGSTAVSLSSFSQVAAVYDLQTKKIYINGTQDASIAYSTNISDVADNVLIGSQTTSTAFFPGIIDDVRIYNRALSAAEIATIYNATR